MTLYIQVDGSNNPINHPCEESNLKMVYTVHDWFYGPPSGWVEFIRVPPPELGVYQVWDESIGADISMAFDHNGLEYKYDAASGKVKDVWHVKDMTDAEKKTKQDSVKAAWAALDPAGPASWVFNETNCRYEPPVAAPTDGKIYTWDESAYQADNTKGWAETIVTAEQNTDNRWTKNPT